MSIDSKDLVLFFRDEINNARTNPSLLISRLQNRKFINDYEYEHALIPNLHYKVAEGRSIINQAVQYLNSRQPVPELLLVESLCEVAYILGQQLCKLKSVEHPEDFLNKANVNLKKQGQKQHGNTQIMIQYGFRKDSQIIPSLIVSDGDPDRTNRNILFNQNMKFLGLSIHEHEQYDYVLVILLNDRLANKPSCECMIF